MAKAQAPVPQRMSFSAAPSFARTTDDWDLLPPLPEIIDAVNKFTRHYFQLGFIPKDLFPERLRTQHRSVSVFFLLGILSVSARLTPALVERYGSAVRASETFMEQASVMALNELYKEPTLERCQAFYLLSIAQQGSGLKHKSSWMLHSQDNLHSGPRAPVLLSASDITALLPSHEHDFANAREPESRAALEDTPPALANPALAYLGVTMIPRLCNIVMRKAYLHEIISDDKSDAERTAFWTDMANKLFWNVSVLYEQIDTHYADRSPEEGPGAQMARTSTPTFSHLVPNPKFRPGFPHRQLYLPMDKHRQRLPQSRDIRPTVSASFSRPLIRGTRRRPPQ
ncbi:hypothetical protein N0V88_003539 [Collariella sp. IMI 366227]|nr:hypothetical protein N0V88_003539 [Collariella sp. IMI 366227]